jgi:hypothetical protein
MHNILIIIAFFSGITGLFFGFRMLKGFNYIIWSEVSLRLKLRNSFLAGISGCLIFFSFIMIAGFLDKNYSLTFSNLARAFLESLIPGLVIFIGTLLRTLQVTGLRRYLIKTINKRKGND